MAMTIETLQKLVALDPKDPLSHFALGKKLLETAWIEDAEEHLRFSHVHAPEHLATYYNFGKDLYFLGKHEEARKVLTEGVRRASLVGSGMGHDLGPLMQQMLDELAKRPSDNISVRLAAPDEVVDLRHRILRDGMARADAIFKGDDDPGTIHAIALDGDRGEAVCCATYMPEPYPHDAGKPSWRLRGMATDRAYQGRGLGRKVLALLEPETQRRNKTPLVWCNARRPAVNFYRSQGWETVGEQYEIPTAGPHFFMIKRL